MRNPLPPVSVLIVGGGIGGIVLGDRLAAQGIAVTICERHLGRTGPSWPEILWPATKARLALCQGGNDVTGRSLLTLGGMQAHVGGRWRELLSREGLQVSPYGPISADPHGLREGLLASSPCKIQRGLTWERPILDGDGSIRGGVFRQAGSGAEVEIRADLVVGDDGSGSRVREAAGIRFDARSFPLDFLCFPVLWPARFPPDEARLWAAPGLPGIAGAMVMPQSPGGRGAGMILVDPAIRAAVGEETLWQACLERLPDFGDFVARAEEVPTAVVRDWGHAGAYGGRGAFLLGDAIHPTSPAGGQGANMAVADAVALGGRVPQGGEFAQLLATYESQRRTANAKSVGITAAVASGFRAPLPGAWRRGLVRGGIRSVSRLGWAPWFLRFPATAFLGGEME